MVHWLAQASKAAATVRVGGPNSGHTVIDTHGARHVFRQVPAGAVLRGVQSLIGPGSYIDPEVLLLEIRQLGLTPNRLSIDPHAVLVTDAARIRERESRLEERIGSTHSGTGAAVLMRAARDGSGRFVTEIESLRPFVHATSERLRQLLDNSERVIVEGTQGFGLSLIHSGAYPFVTSRDTSASAALAEAGLSPIDVDEVVLVIRTFPIRVGGNSGSLPYEIDWSTIAAEGGHDHDLSEFTSVTGRLRRVGRFDAGLVRQALVVNAPSIVVLNHVDYIDHAACATGLVTDRMAEFVRQVESEIGRRIDLVGTNRSDLVRWPSYRSSATVA